MEIDSPTGVDIDACARITRSIEEAFDRDAEDYELEVGSAGITSDFKVRGQYDKNVGNEVEVLTRDGRKLHGTLVEVARRHHRPRRGLHHRSDPESERAGAKRPVVKQEAVALKSADCK